jgi:hypothetical protein
VTKSQRVPSSHETKQGEPRRVGPLPQAPSERAYHAPVSCRQQFVGTQPKEGGMPHFTPSLVHSVNFTSPTSLGMSHVVAFSSFTFWSILATKSGPCNVAYRGAVQVINGNVEVQGAPNNVLSGRASPNGFETVRGGLGANLNGIAWGRPSGNSGSGRWRVQMETGKCFGVWTARRLSR